MAESIFSHLLNGAQIVVDGDIKEKGIGPKIGGGLRSAPSGMAFVDITGRVDADADGIVFEGIPGMERPIIPKFVVPKELAGKLSKLVEGDSMDIEKQRRAGNTNIQFDENKFNEIVSSLQKTQASETGRTGGVSSAKRSLTQDELMEIFDDGGWPFNNRGWPYYNNDFTVTYEPGSEYSPENFDVSPNSETGEFFYQFWNTDNPKGDPLEFLESEGETDWGRPITTYSPWFYPERLTDDDRKVVTDWLFKNHPDIAEQYGLDKDIPPTAGMTSTVSGTKWKGTRPPLSEVNPNADLSGADLSNVDLSGSNLSSANLRYATFRNTNLSDSNLNKANLFAANLSQANMSNVDLREANIFGAQVDGANFTGSLMPDMTRNYMISADRATGMSSRTLDRHGMQSLSTRDRRKLDSFITDTLTEWKRASAGLRKLSSADDPEQAVQDAYQEAVLKLLADIEKNGIGHLDQFFRESDAAQKIQDYIDSGVSDERIAALLEVSQAEIENVRKYGVPSAARSWVNRVKKSSVIDQSRKESSQKGKIPQRVIAEERLNNAVWDLIDSGASDEEIIDSIRSNAKINQPKFNQNTLDKVRKQGRQTSKEGTLGYSQDVSSFEVENARRSRGEEDWASGDITGEELAGEDSGDEGIVVGGDAINLPEEVSDRKVLRVKKLKEALKDSYDVMDFFAQRRGRSARSDEASLDDAVNELGMSKSLIGQHRTLIAEIRKRVEDGTFDDPDWFIPFDEIAELGKTPEGIDELAKKYNMSAATAQLLARQVAGVQRRMDTKSSSSQAALSDFANQFADLIKKGYSRGEIVNIIPNVNSQAALDKRIALAAREGLLDESFIDKEVLSAIQTIRRKGTGAVSDEMLQRIRNLGINIDQLVPVKQMTEEESTFTALQASGKTRGEIISQMNISPEQYQRLYMRLKSRNK